MNYLDAARPDDLVCAWDLVTELLADRAELLPDDLRISLDTWRCDLLAAIEDKAADALDTP